RMDRKDLDTGGRIYTEYWNESDPEKKQDMFFDPSLAWQKTIEYYGNGMTMHHQWIKDTDPGTSGGDVYYRYDSQGRMDRKDLDTGGRIYTEYWNESDPEKKQDMFFDPSLAWQKTIEYYSNGTTMHYQWFKDENPEQDGDTVFEEYNTSGDCILRRYDTGDTWTPGDAQAQAVELNDDALAMNDIQAQKVGIFNGTGMAEPSADPFTG
ncbi:MAG: hypothetical protein HQ594_07625, partial [Candidatus Omnitrophica bacterium]|nr:hypothetical protein [Candidatus Omnitrophota bacterium]